MHFSLRSRKGLDLSGILDGSECRCGASASHANLGGAQCWE
jgi:hypothetical protein